MMPSLERIGLVALFGFVAALQFSIAAAQILLTLVLLAWFALLLVRREPFTVPRLFWPLAAYAGLTLVSAACSREPATSFLDCKQLVLFLVVPAVYRLARGSRAMRVLMVIITVGAASAAVGIIQYSILNYNNLGERPHGTLGHYMTYSGLLMLVIGAAIAHVLFGRQRAWSALVLPALLVAVALTFTRNAWVGVAAAACVLLVLRNIRLLWIVPLVLAIGAAVAPARVTNRFYSMFSLQDPTNRDRIAMAKAGAHMIHDHPLTGVGPNMVQVVYPRYREPDAVEPIVPHLHNVPIQIAAERGLPALAVWIWFVVVALIDLNRRLRSGRDVVVTAAAIAAMVAMLTAGLFEVNFGNSEFLMLFLTLMTLPFAAADTVGERELVSGCGLRAPGSGPGE
jgi:O-antigen ligase